MTGSLEERFQNLHEFVTQARTNLNRNNWDYLIGGSETETTLARNRAALDSWGFRPRVLRDVSNVDCSHTFFGKKLRIPVLCSAVGGLEVFEPGGGATVAAATLRIGNGMILSSGAHPGLEKTADASGDAFKIFQLYVNGDADWVDDHVRRAIDHGYDAFCFTIDTDSHSRRERDIAKRHARARASAPVEGARIHQARFNWRDIERITKNFDIPIVLKGIGTAEDAKMALECGADCVYVSNHGGRQLDQGVGSIDVLPEVVEAVGGRARVMVDGGIYRGTDVVKALILGADVVSVGRLYIYGLAAAGGPGCGPVVRDPGGRDPDLPVAAGRHRLSRARQILHTPGAPSRDPARPQRFPAPQPAARDVLEHDFKSLNQRDIFVRWVFVI